MVFSLWYHTFYASAVNSGLVLLQSQLIVLLRARQRNFVFSVLQGTCRQGARCHFRHSGQSGAAAPPGSSSTGPTRTCRWFASAQGCKFGDRCHFSHVPKTESKRDAAAGPAAGSDAKSDAKSDQKVDCGVMPLCEPLHSLAKRRHLLREHHAVWHHGLCCVWSGPLTIMQQMGCEHSFCLECIRKWRGTSNQSKARSCPLCRAERFFLASQHQH